LLIAVGVLRISSSKGAEEAAADDRDMADADHDAAAYRLVKDE